MKDPNDYNNITSRIHAEIANERVSEQMVYEIDRVFISRMEEKKDCYNIFETTHEYLR